MPVAIFGIVQNVREVLLALHHPVARRPARRSAAWPSRQPPGDRGRREHSFFSRGLGALAGAVPGRGRPPSRRSRGPCPGRPGSGAGAARTGPARRRRARRARVADQGVQVTPPGLEVGLHFSSPPGRRAAGSARRGTRLDQSAERKSRAARRPARSCTCRSSERGLALQLGEPGQAAPELLRVHARSDGLRHLGRRPALSVGALLPRGRLFRKPAPGSRRDGARSSAPRSPRCSGRVELDARHTSSRTSWATSSAWDGLRSTLLTRP